MLFNIFNKNPLFQLKVKDSVEDLKLMKNLSNILLL